MYDHFLETACVAKSRRNNQSKCLQLPQDFLTITFKIKTNMKLFFKNLHPHLNAVILSTRLHQKKWKSVGLIWRIQLIILFMISGLQVEVLIQQLHLIGQHDFKIELQSPLESFRFTQFDQIDKPINSTSQIVNKISTTQINQLDFWPKGMWIP